MGNEADVAAEGGLQTSEETSRSLRSSSRLRKPSRKVVEEMEHTQEEGVSEQVADYEKSGKEVMENREKSTEKAEEFCICRKGDDGKPMVLCANCDEW